MTSKLVVNTIEADTGISSVSFASSISMNSTAKFHFSAAGIDIDADTNINRPAAGALGFNINSSEKVRILSDGKVGINTNNPLTGLHISDGTPYGTPQNPSRKASLTISSGSENSADIQLLSANYNHIFFGDSADPNTGIIWYEHTGSATDSMHFSTAGSERLRITSTGVALIGTPNPINSSTSKFQVAANDATGSAILARFSASSYSSYLDFYKSRHATLGSTTVVNSNDHLGAIRYYGVDGSNSGYTTAAEIYGSCDGGSGASGDMPGRITFHTRPDGAGQSMQERLRIGSDGKVDVTGGYIARNPSDSFTLNGVNTPHYGFQLNASSTVPVAFSGYYGISFATTGVERLRIKKTTGEVGIGDGDPQSTLVVRKDNQTGRGGEISIVNYAGGGASGIGNEAALNFGLENSTYHADNGNAQIKALITAANHSTDMVFSTYNGSGFQESFRINSAGAVTKPYQYVFTATTTNHSKTANWSHITDHTLVAAQCTGVSDGNNWSNSNQRFTAPVAGVYHFFVGGWTYGNSNGSRYAYCFKHTNGNNYTFIGGGDYCSGDSPMAGWSRTIKLSAGEWVELWGYSAIAVRWGGGHNFYWGGYLLG